MGSAQPVTRRNFHSKTTQLKKGLANLLEISCKNCNFFYTAYTSKQVTHEGVRGQMPFDINVRSMISFREIGKGHSAMERVFGLMNFVPIMNFDSYNEVSANVACSYSNVAQACMMEAAEELKGGNNREDLLSNVGVSCDGTWQKRGYSSLLGAVTVISVDINVLITQFYRKGVHCVHLGRHQKVQKVMKNF